MDNVLEVVIIDPEGFVVRNSMTVGDSVAEEPCPWERAVLRFVGLGVLVLEDISTGTPTAEAGIGKDEILELVTAEPASFVVARKMTIGTSTASLAVEVLDAAMIDSAADSAAVITGFAVGPSACALRVCSGGPDSVDCEPATVSSSTEAP